MSRLSKKVFNILCPRASQLLQMLYEFEYMRLSSSGRETLDELAELLTKPNS